MIPANKFIKETKLFHCFSANCVWIRLRSVEIMTENADESGAGDQQCDVDNNDIDAGSSDDEEKK